MKLSLNSNDAIVGVVVAILLVGLCVTVISIIQVNWSETLNSQTVTMQIRSDDNNDMSSPSSWETVTNGDTTISTPANRYIQYKATLSTLDISTTPVLHDVTIRYY